MFQGVVVNFGFGEDVVEAQIANVIEALAADRARRESMSARGQALVDGRGAARVTVLIKERWARVGTVRV